jgi:hypothetical protein
MFIGYSFHRILIECKHHKEELPEELRRICKNSKILQLYLFIMNDNGPYILYNLAQWSVENS